MEAKSLAIVILTIVLASCVPVSIPTPTETTTQVMPTESITSEITHEKAIEVAQKSCGSFRAIQVEEPYESQAMLMSYDDGYKKVHEGAVDPSVELTGNPVWFVILKGRWQGFGFPFGGLTPTPSKTPTIWDICKVLVDSKSGEAFSKSYNWNTPSP